MYRRLPLSVVLALGLLSVASPASANRWLAWLEELSGPGPFKGPTFSVELRCFSDVDTNRKLRRCDFDRHDVMWTIENETSIMDDRPKGYSGDTSLVAVRGLAYVPVGQLFPGLRHSDRRSRAKAVFQQVSVGVGAGVYIISGDTTVESPILLPVLPVRLKVLPVELLVQLCRPQARQTSTVGEVGFSRRLGRAVEYRIGFDYTIAAPNPADFRTAIPQNRRELLDTYSIQIDLGRLFDLF